MRLGSNQRPPPRAGNDQITEAIDDLTAKYGKQPRRRSEARENQTRSITLGRFDDVPIFSAEQIPAASLLVIGVSACELSTKL